ncbi:DoxX family protein [Larkinella humicola]|uniref:DoxX family protein n=1 Tax=Larkinella humicola TaxID=2607654 RepID=A0A5N1JIV3_9BACT|nr:DoxX family protein [Larkinella humicola]KAA9353730.1 DoxX family protein [Larkinella humicola]
MTSQPKKLKILPIALWIVQAMLALLFIGTGIFKLVAPVSTIAGMWPWAGEYPDLLRVTGMFDLGGGIGLILLALTGIKPGLTVVAALGCAALQVSAIVFHFSRGEAANTPFNFVMLGLVLFVFWGRGMKASVSPRT